MFRWLAAIRDLQSSTPRRSRPRSAALEVERLQDRLAPAGLVKGAVTGSLHALVAPAAKVVNGMLYVHGTNAADTTTITFANGIYSVSQNGLTQTFPAAAITSGNAVYFGNDGQDVFTNLTGLRASADGGRGDDTL